MEQPVEWRSGVVGWRVCVGGGGKEPDGVECVCGGYLLVRYALSSITYQERDDRV